MIPNQAFNIHSQSTATAKSIEHPFLFKNNSILNKKRTFLFNTAIKLNKIGNFHSFPHIPQNEKSGETRPYLLAIRLRSYRYKISIFCPTHTYLMKKKESAKGMFPRRISYLVIQWIKLLLPLPRFPSKGLHWFHPSQ